MKVLQICPPHLSDVVTLPGKSKKCQNVKMSVVMVQLQVLYMCWSPAWHKKLSVVLRIGLLHAWQTSGENNLHSGILTLIMFWCNDNVAHTKDSVKSGMTHVDCLREGCMYVYVCITRHGVDVHADVNNVPVRLLHHNSNRHTDIYKCIHYTAYIGLYAE